MSDSTRFISNDKDVVGDGARAVGTTGNSGYAANPIDSSTYTSRSGYATQVQSGPMSSAYGIGSAYNPESSSSYNPENHSTLETAASHVPGTQAHAESSGVRSGAYDSSSGYGSTGHGIAHAGSGAGYIGGTTGETIASYIPGTQANAESKAATGTAYGSSTDYASTSTTGYGHSSGHGLHSSQAPKGSGEGYIGGVAGETIASYIPGTEAHAQSVAIAHDHYSSGNDTTSYGSSTQAPKGSGEGYIGGATGETIASYIPGTQANAESKAIAHDSYGSAVSSGEHDTPASSGILGSIASAIPGTEAYHETHDTTATVESASMAGRDAMTRGYSSTAPASTEYTTTSQRGQGYADKFPGGDTHASGGVLGAAVASYIPGTEAHTGTTGGFQSDYTSGISTSQPGQVSAVHPVTSYIPGTQAHAESIGEYQSGYASGISTSRPGQEPIADIVAASYLPGTTAHTDYTTYGSTVPQYGSQTGVSSALPQYGSQSGMTSSYGAGETYTTAVPSSYGVGESYTTAVPSSYGAGETYTTAMPSSYGVGESYTTGAAPSYVIGGPYTLPAPVQTGVPSLAFVGAAQSQALPTVPPTSEPLHSTLARTTISTVEPSTSQAPSSHISEGTTAVDEDESHKSKETPSQRARGGLTEFDRDEAIMSSVLNEPIRKHGVPVKPNDDEANRREAPRKGKTMANVST